MIILQDSQIKKIFHNGDEVKKILDWDGNVIFYKQSGGGGMTNTIKFHTTSAVTSSLFFKAIYTDYTSDSIKASEPNKQYTLPIQSGKTVKSLDFEDSLVDEVIVSCKIDLSKDFFYKKPKTIRFISCDATSSTSFDSLYRGVKNVETIEMKNSDFSNVTDMSDMFYNCGATTIDISNCNASNVTDMSYMFSECQSLTILYLSNFDTSNVTNMRRMLYNCVNLTSLNLSNLYTSKVTNMSSMFRECKSLTYLDLSNFNTNNVTDMSYMFYYCSNLTSLDLSGWDMTKVTNIGRMLTNCSKLKTIKMIGCNQTTIDKIKSALTDAGILNKVTIVTS